MLKDAEVLIALDDDYEYLCKDFSVACEPHECVSSTWGRVLCLISICITVCMLLLCQSLIHKIKQSCFEKIVVRR